VDERGRVVMEDKNHPPFVSMFSVRVSSFCLGTDISLALARVRINITCWTTAIAGVSLFLSLPPDPKLSCST